MRHLIGFLLIPFCGILYGVTEIPLFIPIMLIGVFLFASIVETDVFFDYALTTEDAAIIRKRHYAVFIPFYMVLEVLTFGLVYVKFPYRDEYFKATNLSDADNIKRTKITRR